MRFFLLFFFIAFQAHGQQDTSVQTRINASLQLSAYFVNKTGEDATDLKKATDHANQALSASLKSGLVNEQARSYALLAQIAREQGNTTAAHTLIDKGTKLLPFIAPWPAAAAVYFEMSAQQELTSGPEALPKANYYKNYYDIYKFNEKDTIKLADATKYYADLLKQTNKNATALYYIKLALELYQKKHYPKTQDVYGLMAAIYFQMNNTHEAIKYGLLAKKIMEEFKDSSNTACTIYHQLGSFYSILSQPLESCHYEEKAYIISKRLDIGTQLFIAANLATTYDNAQQHDKASKILNEAIAMCSPDQKGVKLQLQLRKCINYIHSKEYQKGLEVFHQLEPFIADPAEISSTHSYITGCGVELYLRIRNYAEAKKYLRMLASQKKDDNSLFLRMNFERYSFRLDSSMGLYQSAIQHYQHYKIFADSLALTRHDRQLAELQVEYETEKKDHDLKIQEKHISLLTVETGRQKEQIYSDTIKRYFSYAIAILLLLLLGIAFWAYNTKRKSNVQLQAQQTEINHQNTTLKQLLEEREWLLKEVHHRVKNNLQIVISLLNSQARHLNSESAKQALRESKNRMHAISIIHQKLYRSDSFSSVNMDFYIRELLDFLQDSFSIHDIVSIETDGTDIEVSQAVPIGLIVNEAVTNAIKHAIPYTVDPRINIQIHCQAEKISLLIADNGPGMPAAFNPQQSNSFGINLIMGLVRQLRGKAVFTNNGGTQILITFKRSKVLT